MKLFLIILYFFINNSYAKPILNVYAWGGEIPQIIIKNFEKKTGIEVHFSTYDNNETLYAKLIAGASNYDIIMPSSYYVERLKRHKLLLKLQQEKIPNKKYLEKFFQNPAYDTNNAYSMPLIWGATGIFYNKNYIKNPPLSWKEFWEPSFKDKLLLLDDAREIFSIALLSLGYSPNDLDPRHIKLALKKLFALKTNIKIFASDGVKSILIDEDAIVGSIWNGDAKKAMLENKALTFLFPKEGFVIWVDCIAIPKNAKNKESAYKWINYLLEPKIAKQIALIEGHAITNKAGKNLLPEKIKNNKIIYPDNKILKKGIMQRDLPEEILELYNNYWQDFKL